MAWFSHPVKTKRMQKLLLLFIIGLLFTQKSLGQKVDSIYFNLYTDSLKKGTHNYINVDGLLSNGRYLPLTEKELIFAVSAGKMEGNSLWLDPGFKEEKITIKATLKSNPKISREAIIYIKKIITEEKLPTAEEILKNMKKKGRSG